MRLILRINKVPQTLVDELSLHNKVIELVDLHLPDEQAIDIILATPHVQQWKN